VTLAEIAYRTWIESAGRSYMRPLPWEDVSEKERWAKVAQAVADEVTFRRNQEDVPR
jgi:hypothetical protein